MSKAKYGNTVKIHYTGTTADDTVFGATKPGQPLEFEIGSGEMSALEIGVTGMQEGEKRTFTVPPEEAFGPKRNELMSVVKKSKFPDHISPTIGQHLHLKRADGRIIDVTVTEIIDGLVVLDTNHPLAGQTLKITVEMIDIK